MTTITGTYPVVGVEPPRAGLVQTALIIMVALVAGVARSVVVPAPATADVPAIAEVRTGPIASHNGAVRAEIVDYSADRMIVRVTDARGRRVSHADIQARAAMPVSARSSASVPTVRYLRDGKYRITNMGLDAAGWWNVPLVVSSGRGVDSLALNVIVR